MNEFIPTNGARWEFLTGGVTALSINRWEFLTGGVTALSIKAIREFVKRFVPPEEGWRLHSVDLDPEYPLDYDGFHTEGAATMMLFERRNGSQMRVLVTDGFAWGYSGEGPSGLATILAELWPIDREKLREMIGSKDQNGYHTLFL